MTDRRVAPDVELQSTSGPRRLHPQLGHRLVLVFYQEDGTPSCATELASFKEEIDLLRELGAEVMGISTDSLDRHREFLDRLGGLPYPLLTDTDGEAARAFGAWDPETRRARRAVFVVDDTGAVIHSVVPYNPSILSDYESVFRALGLDS